jgi:hypothetical protein
MAVIRHAWPFICVSGDETTMSQESLDLEVFSWEEGAVEWARSVGNDWIHTYGTGNDAASLALRSLLINRPNG